MGEAHDARSHRGGAPALQWHAEPRAGKKEASHGEDRGDEGESASSKSDVARAGATKSIRRARPTAAARVRIRQRSGSVTDELGHREEARVIERCTTRRTRSIHLWRAPCPRRRSWPSSTRACDRFQCRSRTPFDSSRRSRIRTRGPSPSRCTSTCRWGRPRSPSPSPSRAPSASPPEPRPPSCSGDRLLTVHRLHRSRWECPPSRRGPRRRSRTAPPYPSTRRLRQDPPIPSAHRSQRLSGSAPQSPDRAPRSRRARRGHRRRCKSLRRGRRRLQRR